MSGIDNPVDDNGSWGPITLGYDESTTSSGAISTTLVTTFSSTVVVPAGRRIRVTYFEPNPTGTAAGDTFSLVIRQDGGNVQHNLLEIASSNTQPNPYHLPVVLAPTAGTHTYTANVVRNTGTGSVTLNRNSQEKAYFLVEDITGVADPVTPGSVPVGALAYTQQTSSIGPFTAETDLMSVNIVVPAGRQIKITGFQVAFSDAVNTAIMMQLKEGATALEAVHFHTVVANQSETFMGSVVLSPSAGSHTYKMTMARAAGSGNVTAQGSSNMPAWLLVEDITPTPAPTDGAPTSTLGYAEVTANQGSITTEVDLTGLSTTITVPAGRRIRITAQCEFSNTTANQNNRLRIKEGATVLKVIDEFNNTTGNEQQAIGQVVLSPTAGTHTYKLTASTGAGTLTMVANATIPAFILVEDITGVYAPNPTFEGAAWGPILLGYAEKSADQTLTTGTTDLTDPSVTVTVPANRRIRISFMGVIQNQSGVASWSVLNLKEDGVNIKNTVESHAASGNAIYATHHTTAIRTPTAGSHTYTVQVQVSNANMLVESNGNRKVHILVEDITGVSEPVDLESVPVGTLAYATQTAIHSGITSIVPLNNIGQPNIVVPTGRTVKITFGASSIIGGATGNKASLFLRQDGTIVSAATVDTQTTPRDFSTEGTYITSPSAGSHTYRLDAELTNGSVNISVNGAYIIVEDVSPTPAPASGAPSSTLGYAQVTANQTGITTEQDLIGLSTTITVPAGRRIRITGHAGIFSDVANDMAILEIEEGGTTLDFVRHNIDVAGRSDTFPLVTAVVSPSAGSHTYNLAVSREVGTGTLIMVASASNPAFILVEDITGVSVPIPVSTGLWQPGNELPSNPSHGDLFYETDTDKLWAWNGTSWVELARSGVWTVFTPALTGVTVGNGVTNAAWIRSGRKITSRVAFSLGSTSAITGNVAVGIPFATAPDGRQFAPGWILDNGTRHYLAGAIYDPGNATGTFVHSEAGNAGIVNATSPMTWAVGDAFAVEFTYEAATST